MPTAILNFISTFLPVRKFPSGNVAMHRGNAVTYGRITFLSFLYTWIPNPALIGNWWVGNNATLSCKFRLTLRTLTYSFQPCATTDHPYLPRKILFNAIQFRFNQFLPSAKRQILVMNKYSWTGKHLITSRTGFSTPRAEIKIFHEIIRQPYRIFPS